MIDFMLLPGSLGQAALDLLDDFSCDSWLRYQGEFARWEQVLCERVAVKKVLTEASVKTYIQEVLTVYPKGLEVINGNS